MIALPEYNSRKLRDSKYLVCFGVRNVNALNNEVPIFLPIEKRKKSKKNCSTWVNEEFVGDYEGEMAPKFDLGNFIIWPD